MTSATIGDLSREFGVTPRTIRFYEDEGMLTPDREGQRRLYGRRDRVRLKLILRGKRLGFSLAEIREILTLYETPPGEAGQLRFLVDKIGARRGELLQKRRDIEATLAELDGLEESCRVRLGQMVGENSGS